MLKRWLLAGAGALALAANANANAETYGDAVGTTIHGFAPVIGCSANGACSGPVSATNPLPVTGTISASLSGFTPGGAYATPLAVSTANASVALPAGTVVVVYNTGASSAYVRLGASGVVASIANDVVPAGGWMAFTVGANTYLGAITASGSTTLNISGGSGLPTGAGGGASGGGGSVAQGAAAAGSGAWPVYATVGGAAVSAANGLFVNPATGATFPVSGSVSISGTSNVAVTSEIGAGATGSAVPAGAQYAGMNVGGNLTGMTGTANGLKVDGSAVTQPVSLASLPSLAAGSAAIGSITNTSFAATQGSASALNATVVGTGTFAVQAAQSGTWNIGSIGTLPALAAGTATVGNVGVNNQPVGAAALATSQAAPTTAATLIVAARTGAVGTGRVAATIFNSGSVTVYVGASGVATTSGIPLLPGASLTLNTSAAIYGVVSGGAGAVATVETY